MTNDHILFRDFSDVYFQSLEIMKERELSGIVSNEGILFFKIDDSNE